MLIQLKGQKRCNSSWTYREEKSDGICQKDKEQYFIMDYT